MRRPARRQMLTETQKNGQRQAQAVKSWSRLLECNKGFAPIVNKDVKKNTAMLLENQMRWINEASMNTSMFGPNNGVTGGALTGADSYATGDNRLPRVLLPMVRRIYPALMSNETVGVQPMPGPVALAYALRYKYLQGPHAAGDSAVNHIHKNVGAATDKPEGWVAAGVKGVETTTQFIIKPGTAVEDKTVKGLVVIVEHNGGYPKVQAAKAVVVEGEAGKATLVDTRFGFKFETTVADLTANAAKAETEDPLTLASHPVGISLPMGEGNVDIRPGFAFNPVTGEKQDYSGNDEMGYQRLDTRFTGRQDTRLLQPLAGGRFKFRPEDTGIAAHVQQFEGTGAVARTAFGFEKQAVEAGTRRLSTSWTLETEEDLKNTNGIDIDTEATQQMSYELQAEIDREMTVRMLYSCLSKDEWSVWSGALADARWMGERARAFYQHLIKMSIRMRVRNRRGAANFIVCTPDVAALLETLDEFIAMPVNTNVTTSNASSASAGTLGGNRFNVFIDDRTPVYDGHDYGYGYKDMFAPVEEGFQMPNYCMLGYKGTDVFDAGIIYCPYIPIMVQTATDPYSFEPQVGLMTRYGVMDHIFGAHLYYHCIIIDSFSQAGLSDNVQSLYPAGYAGHADDKGMLAGEKVQYAFPTQVTSLPTTTVGGAEEDPNEP